MSGELEAKRRRLGMDAVAAPDGRRVFVLEGAPLQHREQSVEIGQQKVGRLLQLHRQAGVEDIARGHALMDEAGIGADMLGEVGQKRDHVVMRLTLYLVDALDLESAALSDGVGRTLGDHAECGLSIAGMGLDLEPDPIPVLRRPDPGHLRSAIAGDHDGTAACATRGS